MSLQPLSSESSTSSASKRDICRQLDRYLKQQMRPGFFGQLLLRLQDPFSEQKGFRLNPSWAGLAALFALAAAVFLYFNFFRR